MAYLCKSCGGEEPVQNGVPCSACGRRHFILKAEPGELKITGSPIGMIVEGNPDNPLGRRVESRPASGGAVNSVVAADGTFQATLSGSLTSAALENGVSSTFSATNCVNADLMFASMMMLAITSAKTEC
jgi:hypothetical protein